MKEGKMNWKLTYYWDNVVVTIDPFVHSVLARKVLAGVW